MIIKWGELQNFSDDFLQNIRKRCLHEKRQRYREDTLRSLGGMNVLDATLRMIGQDVDALETVWHVYKQSKLYSKERLAARSMLESALDAAVRYVLSFESNPKGPPLAQCKSRMPGSGQMPKEGSHAQHKRHR